MALLPTTLVQARFKLILGTDPAFTSRPFEENFTLDQTTEEAHTSTYFVDGTVTDEAISMGKVNSPTFIYVRFVSKYNGDNSTTEDQDALVTVKVDGGTAYTTNSFLAEVTDPVNDTTTSTITFSTLADTDTIVTLVVLGRSS